MLLPFIIDFRNFKKEQANKNVKNGRRPTQAEEDTCMIKFTTRFSYVETLCSRALELEKNEPGSSDVPESISERMNFVTGRLPTEQHEEARFTDRVLMTYIGREIFHFCKYDLETGGPFTFLKEIVQCIVSGYETLKNRGDEKVLRLFYSLFSPKRPYVAEEEEGTEETNARLSKFKEEVSLYEKFGNHSLLTNANSHLCFVGKWHQMIRGLHASYVTNSSTEQKPYQGHSAYFASNFKYLSSFKHRFQSWWLSAAAVRQVKEAAMLKCLDLCLECLFQYKPMNFSSGFEISDDRNRTVCINKQILQPLNFGFNEERLQSDDILENALVKSKMNVDSANPLEKLYFLCMKVKDFVDNEHSEPRVFLATTNERRKPCLVINEPDGAKSLNIDHFELVKVNVIKKRMNAKKRNAQMTKINAEAQEASDCIKKLKLFKDKVRFDSLIQASPCKRPSESPHSVESTPSPFSTASSSFVTPSPKFSARFSSPVITPSSVRRRPLQRTPLQHHRQQFPPQFPQQFRQPQQFQQQQQQQQQQIISSPINASTFTGGIESLSTNTLKNQADKAINYNFVARKEMFAQVYRLLPAPQPQPPPPSFPIIWNDMNKQVSSEPVTLSFLTP